MAKKIRGEAIIEPLTLLKVESITTAGDHGAARPTQERDPLRRRRRDQPGLGHSPIGTR